MRHLLVTVVLLGLAACTKSAERNCYLAPTRADYDHYAKLWAESDHKITVNGTEFNCVDNLATGTGACYKAKSREEFQSLTEAQMKHPNMLVVVGEKTFDCLKAPE